jgi:hypothetical protein
LGELPPFFPSSEPWDDIFGQRALDFQHNGHFGESYAPPIDDQARSLINPRDVTNPSNSSLDFNY